MKWEDSNVTLSVSNPNELQSLIAKNAVMLKIPAKTVFLEPGSKPEGVYYIASGRTRHYMIAQDGSEKILYTLSAGWFYGETPCALHDATRLFSKAEVPSILYCIPNSKYEMLLDESPLFREAILLSYSKKMRILRQEIANEEARLAAARGSTAAYVAKLQGLYQHEMDYLNGLSSLVAPAPKGPDPVAAAAHLAAGRSVITRADLDGPSLCSVDPYEGGPVFDEAAISMTGDPGIGVGNLPCAEWR